jgi:hypothetical protein
LHNAADFAPCPVCARPIKAEVFPACYAPPEAGRAGETLVVDGDSSCFYHPAKKAETVCETCGRFLCALCDVELNGAHICPSCLQSGKRKGKLKQLENRRTLWDSVALTLAVAPMLFFYFTVLTAPGVIYVVIRYWKSPTSVVGRGKWRYVVAFIIALLQIAGWAFLIYFIQRQMHLAAIHKVH